MTTQSSASAAGDVAGGNLAPGRTDPDGGIGAGHIGPVTADPDQHAANRVLTCRRLTAFAGTDHAVALAERVARLVGHGRRMTTVEFHRYADGSTGPLQVTAGLTLARNVSVYDHGRSAGFSCAFAGAGLLDGFGFAAVAGANGTAREESGRFHRGDRDHVTKIVVVGGLPNDGPAHDDALTIQWWTGDGNAARCRELTVAFDTGLTDLRADLTDHMRDLADQQPWDIRNMYVRLGRELGVPGDVVDRVAARNTGRTDR